MEKVLKYQAVNNETQKQRDFYEDELAVIRGRQDWIGQMAEGPGSPSPTAPMQLELEPGITKEEDAVEIVAEFLADHCRRGGTLINLNILNANKIWWWTVCSQPCRYRK